MRPAGFPHILRALILAFTASGTSAQEWHFGAHLNPTITISTPTDKGASTDLLHMNRGVADLNTGINLRYRNGRWGGEAGANLISKTVRYKLLSGNGISSNYLSFSGHSLELPLLASYALYRYRGVG